MKANNRLILFLQENLQRLFTKSPKFFQIWMWISGVLVLMTGLPGFVNWLTGIITIPDIWSVKITEAVAWASRAAFMMSLLTTQSQSVSISDNGTLLKMTDEKKLPFTAQDERKNSKLSN